MTNLCRCIQNFWTLQISVTCQTLTEVLQIGPSMLYTVLLKSLLLQFIQAFKLSKFILATLIFIISSLELCKLLSCFFENMRSSFRSLTNRFARVIAFGLSVARYRFCTKFQHRSEIATVCGQRLPTRDRPSASRFAAYLIRMFRLFERVLPLVARVRPWEV